MQWRRAFAVSPLELRTYAFFERQGGRNPVPVSRAGIHANTRENLAIFRSPSGSHRRGGGYPFHGLRALDAVNPAICDRHLRDHEASRIPGLAESGQVRTDKRHALAKLLRLKVRDRTRRVHPCSDAPPRLTNDGPGTTAPRHLRLRRGRARWTPGRDCRRPSRPASWQWPRRPNRPLDAKEKKGPRLGVYPPTQVAQALERRPVI